MVLEASQAAASDHFPVFTMDEGVTIPKDFKPFVAADYFTIKKPEPEIINFVDASNKFSHSFNYNTVDEGADPFMLQH